MLCSFDALESDFENIELFLALYPEDKNIENAATDLVVVALRAVEMVISFYLKRSGWSPSPASDWPANIAKELEAAPLCSKGTITRKMSSRALSRLR
jgi:hypothetical protein